MPRIRASEREIKIARMEGLIRTGLQQQRLNFSQLAERMNMSVTKLQHIRKDPWMLRLREIERMSAIIGISEHEVLSVLMNTPKKE